MEEEADEEYPIANSYCRYYVVFRALHFAVLSDSIVFFNVCK